MYRTEYEFNRWENALVTSHGWVEFGRKPRIFRRGHYWVLEVFGQYQLDGWERA
ncbi:MAG TPA: hypothetical protein VFH56_02430 [Acidimicrobiales bacterium]|nr:hypothetical protein [Acidimicrobiales bacterium]